MVKAIATIATVVASVAEIATAMVVARAGTTAQQSTKGGLEDASYGNGNGNNDSDGNGNGDSKDSNASTDADGGALTTAMRTTHLGCASWWWRWRQCWWGGRSSATAMVEEVAMMPLVRAGCLTNAMLCFCWRQCLTAWRMISIATSILKIPPVSRPAKRGHQ